MPYSVTVKSQLWNVFKIVLEKCEVFEQKSLPLKKYFKINNSQTWFCCLYVNLSAVKIWGQSDRFPLSFSSLQFPRLFKWKKLIREISANYVTQTGNFYFQQNVKPPFLCQYLMLFSDFFFTLKIVEIFLAVLCDTEWLRYVIFISVISTRR